MRLQQRITVNRSIEDVFDFVTGLENFSLWMTNLLRAEQLASECPGSGAAAVVPAGRDGLWAPERMHLPAEVIAFEPPHLFAWRSTGAHAPVTTRFALEAGSAGTTLTMIRHLDMANPLVAERVTKQSQADILAMKALLERNHVPPVAEGAPCLDIA